jgi:hypothetical protein
MPSNFVLKTPNLPYYESHFSYTCNHTHRSVLKNQRASNKNSTNATSPNESASILHFSILFTLPSFFSADDTAIRKARDSLVLNREEGAGTHMPAAQEGPLAENLTILKIPSKANCVSRVQKTKTIYCKSRQVHRVTGATSATLTALQLPRHDLLLTVLVIAHARRRSPLLTFSLVLIR